MIDSQSLQGTLGTVSPRMLRKFAGLCLGIFGVLFLLSWYRHGGVPTRTAWIGLVVGVLLGVVGLAKPALIRPVFLGAIAATRPIGQAASVLVLAVVYYGCVTPVALVFRWRGRDTLARRRPDAPTYWVRKQPRGDVRRYLRQYQRQ
jgi:drug/metabolite transporter (DMT)-like permease